jgi:hypothetical protein
MISIELARMYRERAKERCRTDIFAWARRARNLLRQRARVRGVPFSLTVEDVYHLIPTDRLCPVLKVPLDFGGPRSAGRAEFDRHIPALGYIPGNVTIISHRANILKSDCMDGDALRRVADYVDRVCPVNKIETIVEDSPSHREGVL